MIQSNRLPRLEIDVDASIRHKSIDNCPGDSVFASARASEPHSINDGPTLNPGYCNDRHLFALRDKLPHLDDVTQSSVNSSPSRMDNFRLVFRSDWYTNCDNIHKHRHCAEAVLAVVDILQETTNDAMAN